MYFSTFLSLNSIALFYVSIGFETNIHQKNSNINSPIPNASELLIVRVEKFYSNLEKKSNGGGHAQKMREGHTTGFSFCKMVRTKYSFFTRLGFLCRQFSVTKIDYYIFPFGSIRRRSFPFHLFQRVYYPSRYHRLLNR